MSPKELEAILAQGEGPTVEFKQTLPPEPIVARFLTGFANAEGGVLIIGVNPKGEPAGLSGSDAFEIAARLDRLVSSLFSWPVEVGITHLRANPIVYVQVPKAPDHLRPVTTSTGEIFVTRESGPERVVFGRGARPSEQPPREVLAFVAMSFRTEEEPALVDYYKAMERAVKAADLPIKLDRVDQPGDFEISQQIMDRIKSADIVIADFTFSPRNVYFEAGFARACPKRLIQMARKETNLEFDVRNWHTILYRNATELEAKLIPELVVAYMELTR